MSIKNTLIDTKVDELRRIIKQLEADIATYEGLREAPDGVQAPTDQPNVEAKS